MIKIKTFLTLKQTAHSEKQESDAKHFVVESLVLEPRLDNDIPDSGVEKSIY
jgi:hypothetical protein